MARPTKYTKVIENTIIKRIKNGESVAKICLDPKMPNRNTLFDWISKKEELSNRYTQALQDRTHLYAEQRHDIINEAIDGLATMPEGVNVNVFGNLIKEKIRIIEWDAERLAAKKYKPKQDLDDASESQPLSISFEVSEPVKDITITNAKT